MTNLTRTSMRCSPNCSTFPPRTPTNSKLWLVAFAHNSPSALASVPYAKRSLVNSALWLRTYVRTVSRRGLSCSACSENQIFWKRRRQISQKESPLFVHISVAKEIWSSKNYKCTRFGFVRQNHSKLKDSCWVASTISNINLKHSSRSLRILWTQPKANY